MNDGLCRYACAVFNSRRLQPVSWINSRCSDPPSVPLPSGRGAGWLRATKCRSPTPRSPCKSSARSRKLA